MTEQRATEQARAMVDEFVSKITTDSERASELRASINRYLDEPPDVTEPEMSRLTADEKRLGDQFYDCLLGRGGQVFTGGNNFTEYLDDGTVAVYPAP